MGARAGGEHARRLPLLQARHSPPARARRRLGHQRRLVRRRRRRRHVADLVHGVEGSGPVETPLLLRIWSETPGAAERRLVHVPMGRMAKPREIVNAALFLASDESSYVNAATFVVDGGLTAAYVTPE